MPIASWILYGTTGCHLCAEADALIARVLSGLDEPQDIVKRDIASDAGALERYAWLIPVLRDEKTGRELHWPFDEDELRGFLSTPMKSPGE